MEPSEANTALIVLLVCSLASAWGSSLIINAFFIFGKGRGFAIMVLFLALGDFVWSVASVLSSIVLLANPDLYTIGGPLCLAFRFTYQLGAFSSLIWGLGILLFILLALARAKSTGGGDESSEGNVSKVWWLALGFLAFGYPIVIGVVMIALGDWNGSPGFLCFPSLEKELWVYPIMGVFVLSLILMIVVIYHYQSYRSNQSHRIVGRSVTLTVPFRSSLFSLVLLLCWTPNVVNQLIGGGPFWFTVVWLACLNSQGVWDSLIYGFTNGRFRAFFRKRFARTLILLILGPLLILPLFIRWAYKALQKKCCGAPKSSRPFQESFSMLGERPSSPETSFEQPTSSSSSKSLFPLSASGNHPLPRLNYATSFTPPLGKSVQIQNDSLASMRLDADDFEDDQDD